jgi:hypothetical protein
MAECYTQYFYGYLLYLHIYGSKKGKMYYTKCLGMQKEAFVRAFFTANGSTGNCHTFPLFFFAKHELLFT